MVPVDVHFNRVVRLLRAIFKATSLVRWAEFRSFIWRQFESKKNELKEKTTTTIQNNATHALLLGVIIGAHWKCVMSHGV